MKRPFSAMAGLGLSVLLTQADRAQAAEIKVWTARAGATVLAEVGPRFERTTGHTLVVSTDLPAPFVKRAQAGEPFDVLITTAGPLDGLIQEGRILADTRTDIARSGIGVGVRAGARKPDIRSVEAFKRALLEAKSIAYLKNVGSGLHVARVIEQLGLAEALRSKVTRPESDAVSELVAKGEVELGLVVITQILTTPGVELVGPLPPELKSHVAFLAGVSAHSKAPAAARDLIHFLTGPIATPVFRAQGMEPTSAAEEGMEDRQVTALTEMMRAVNTGDAKAYARLYAHDAVITIHGSGVFEGRGAIEAHEVELLREFPGARLGFYTVWQKGPVAVVHYGVNGRTPAGQPMGHEGLLFYRFQPSGLIDREDRYLDSLTPMAQLGLLGPLPARSLPTLPGALKVHTTKGSPEENANVALVRASFAALDSKDEAAFLSNIADDAVLDEMTEPRPLVGKRNVKAWFEKWTGVVPDAQSEIATLFGIGEFVLVETVVRGTLKGALGPLAPSDRKFSLHRAAIVHVKEGKIARITAFMNGKELAQAVGQWPPTPGQPPRP